MRPRPLRLMNHVLYLVIMIILEIILYSYQVQSTSKVIYLIKNDQLQSCSLKLIINITAEGKNEH